jgi:cation diffusion facilitator CzcD-associated flavoprotein CzcO
VIGTGASGIQVIQECSKEALELTSYQRTPNMCLPMCQEDLPADTDLKRKTDGVYDQAFSGCLDTFAGESSFLFFSHPASVITSLPRTPHWDGLRNKGLTPRIQF